MGFIVILLIIGAIIYFKMKQDPKWIKERTKGRSENEKKVIRYFLREGCLAGTISDEQYDQMVADKLSEFNFKEKALDKHGLDEEMVQEIPPVTFDGYVFDNKSYALRGKDGYWRSSKYQVTWIFFGESQVYFYQYTFNMDEAGKRESTEEYFYKDITNFSTASETEEVTSYDKNGSVTGHHQIETNIFQLVVPGDKIKCSMKLNDETENIIKGMKNKLREKKQA